MDKYIKVGTQNYIVEYPDKCPICHHHSEIPVIKTMQEPNQQAVQVIFECAYSGCKSYFIGYYGPVHTKELKSLKPQRSEITSIPESVKELSPTFVSIYQEADEAKSHGLKIKGDATL